ncbi:TetR/AcrR family transcriptional regulator [Jiangella asiatica]|uniref:TetR/AcrR family transcriptional regulator n=1 Tax=Jiangella asiatica TaxID=2530372 RepID=UPI0013A5E723|nr:TetR/AcrR family transcriptional regulator [Jiangella asiatica]
MEARQRIPAAERRQQMLAAASVVFGERGYAAATTDQIAAAAGVSQAYVVRVFGGKENLFVEVARRAIDRITTAFRGAIAESNSTGSDDPKPVEARLGEAYIDLIADRGILLSLLQIFSLGHDPVIGPIGREGFLSIYRVVRDEAGLAPADASRFMSEGMMINTVLALQLQESPDPDAAEMVTEVCGGDLGRFRSLAGTYPTT